MEVMSDKKDREWSAVGVGEGGLSLQRITNLS